MIIKRLGFSVALAALLIGTAAVLRYGQGAGWVTEDTAERAIQVLVGLMLAAYANIMPKDLGRSLGSIRAAAAAQRAVRIGAWSLTLAGLASAALWVFAPRAVADIGSIVVVASAMAITLAFAGWTFATCRRTSLPGPT
jgi:hypothetical protein